MFRIDMSCAQPLYMKNQFFNKKDSFGKYLTKLWKFEVLAADEEYRLCMLVKAHRVILERLEEHPDIKSKHEQCMFLNISEANFDAIAYQARKAKHKLMQHNIRLVVYIAKRYQNRGISTEDLVQEGTIGLNRAIDKFDPEKGYKLSTYAYWWIRQAITKTLACSSRTIKLPPDIYNLITEIKRLSKTYEAEKGRSPSIREIALKLNKEEDKVYQAMMSCKQFLSYEDLQSYLDTTEMSSSGAYDGLYSSNDDITEFSIDMLDQLEPMEQVILIKKFGLNGAKPMSYKQIANDLQCSLTYLNKIRDSAFDKVRKLCSTPYIN